MSQLWITFVIVTSVAGAFAQCPVDDIDECVCGRRNFFGTFEHWISCTDLRNVSQMPTFERSERLFEELKFFGQTSLNVLQTNAFFGVQIKGLFLDKTGIHTIQSGAFSGLE